MKFHCLTILISLQNLTLGMVKPTLSLSLVSYLLKLMLKIPTPLCYAWLILSDLERLTLVWSIILRNLKNLVMLLSILSLPYMKQIGTLFILTRTTILLEAELQTSLLLRSKNLQSCQNWVLLRTSRQKLLEFLLPF